VVANNLVHRRREVGGVSSDFDGSLGQESAAFTALERRPMMLPSWRCLIVAYEQVKESQGGRQKNFLLAFAALFLISGMAGLIYQTIWNRMLALVFGTTLPAVTTVLAAFMGGLALGSFIFGRVADKSIHLARMYGVLEICVGLYAFAIEPLFAALRRLTPVLAQSLGEDSFSFQLIRLLLCFAVLVPPATLMGGTLPVLSRALAQRESSIGQVIGMLYGLNTLGAVAGTFLAGFVFIRVFGISASLIGTGILNIIAGAIAVALDKPLARHLASAAATAAAAKAGQGKTKDRNGRLVLACYAAAGFAALACEVAWARALSLVLGSSVYAFTTMLGTFLAGLAIGGVVAGKHADRIANRWQLFAVLELGIGFMVLLSSVILGRLPVLYLNIFFGLSDVSFFAVQALIFGLAMLVMILPTLLMGAAFPVAARLLIDNPVWIGRKVGDLYFVNTLGGIAGSIIAGFVLIPLIGTRLTIEFTAAVFFVVGLVFLMTDEQQPKRARLLTGVVFAALAAVFAVILPPWEQVLMTSGVYVYAPQMRDGFEGQREFLYFKEGLHSLVAVTSHGGIRSLRINGKTDGSTGEDMATQVLLAQLPLLVRRGAKDALIIGLGTGVTAGSAATHSGLSVDCLEIDPAVREAAAKFNDVNQGALDNPAVNIIEADARTWLAHQQKMFDVIISEPSNPWITGVSNLFTLEHFRTCRSQLKPDGVICQWIHSYFMSLDNLRIIFRTFQAVFPNASLWASAEGDFLLLASPSPLPFDDLISRLNQPWTPAIAQDLARIGVTSPADLAARCLLSPQGLSALANEGPLNTDDKPIVEFLSPQSIYLNTHPANLQAILAQAEQGGGCGGASLTAR